MYVCVRLLVSLAVVFGYPDFVAESTLIDTEIDILIANNFTVTKNFSSGTITVAHHGFPDHDFEGGWGNNPNEAIKVYHSYDLPMEATVSTPKGCASTLGPIGLAISGGAFYNPYTGFGYNAVEGICNETLDSCAGHPSPDGTYHYHQLPHCLYTGDLRDKFLGVALDGYPIYGPMDKTGKNWTTAELDICHGHYYEGRYMYRATYEFPYILGCFHGNRTLGSRPTQERPGDRPPPPGRRQRRHASSEHVIHRRQMPNRDSTDLCRQVVNSDWQDVCYVQCQNPGLDTTGCTISSGVTSTLKAPITSSANTRSEVTTERNAVGLTDEMVTTPNAGRTSHDPNTSKFALTEDEIQELEHHGISVIRNDVNQTLTVRHVGIPSHNYTYRLSAQNHSFNIPRLATIAEDKGCVRLGSIGLSISGAAFFNPYTRFGYNAVEGDCKESFDNCSGHPTGTRLYHYHKLPACLYNGPDLRDKLLGVALDGYPIYGPMDSNGKNWTSKTLDKCHGHTDATDGRYKYRITTDFPYILGCYHGETIASPRRMRRDTSSTSKIRRYRRQITANCEDNEDDWIRETCHAYCQTPAFEYDSCPPASDVIYDDDDVRDDSDEFITTPININNAPILCSTIQLFLLLNALNLLLIYIIH